MYHKAQRSDQAKGGFVGTEVKDGDALVCGKDKVTSGLRGKSCILTCSSRCVKSPLRLRNPSRFRSSSYFGLSILHSFGSPVSVFSPLPISYVQGSGVQPTGVGGRGRSGNRGRRPGVRSDSRAASPREAPTGWSANFHRGITFAEEISSFYSEYKPVGGQRPQFARTVSSEKWEGTRFRVCTRDERDVWPVSLDEEVLESGSRGRSQRGCRGRVGLCRSYWAPGPAPASHRGLEGDGSLRLYSKGGARPPSRGRDAATEKCVEVAGACPPRWSPSQRSPDARRRCVLRCPCAVSGPRRDAGGVLPRRPACCARGREWGDGRGRTARGDLGVL